MSIATNLDRDPMFCNAWGEIWPERCDELKGHDTPHHDSAFGKSWPLGD